jgi:hypothetical protein
MIEQASLEDEKTNEEKKVCPYSKGDNEHRD